MTAVSSTASTNQRSAHSMWVRNFPRQIQDCMRNKPAAKFSPPCRPPPAARLRTASTALSGRPGYPAAVAHVLVQARHDARVPGGEGEVQEKGQPPGLRAVLRVPAPAGVPRAVLRADRRVDVSDDNRISFEEWEQVLNGVLLPLYPPPPPPPESRIGEVAPMALCDSHVAGCGEHLPAWGLRDDRIPGH